MVLDLKITVESKNDYVIVNPKGELDDYHAPDLNDILTDLINQKKYTKIIINLENTSYVDSVGLGVIVLAGKKIANIKGMFGVVCNKPQVVKLLDSSGLMSMIKRNIKLFNDLNTAIKEIS